MMATVSLSAKSLRSGDGRGARRCLPLAAGLGWRAGVSLSHGASGGGEGSPEGTDSGRLGEDWAEHLERKSVAIWGEVRCVV